MRHAKNAAADISGQSFGCPGSKLTANITVSDEIGGYYDDAEEWTGHNRV